MSFYGLNRAAINAGVASFVAGAALLAASSTVEASATRVVLPETSVICSSDVAVTGVRTCLGSVGFVTEVTGSAFPALLQLQFADIHITSGLKATYTNAWAHQTSVLEADGFITRPGAINATGHFEASAVPLLGVGFVSNLEVTSSASADASVQRDGQTTVERDGYAKQVIQSSFTVEGLKTALGYAGTLVSSECSAVPIKIHGGSVEFTNLFTVSVVASTDMAISESFSTFSADGLLTQSGQAAAEFDFSLVSAPTVIRPGQVDEIVVVSDGWAIPRLGVLAQANSVALSSSGADGFIIKLGSADSAVTSFGTAQWSILVDGAAVIANQSNMTALPYTNAEAADPPNRTMRRIGVDRVMRRPFVDRVMRRQA